MKRIVGAVALLALLGGCGVFGGGKVNKPKTAVLGERIPILATENGIDVDPGIADTPVVLPPATNNDNWTQSGGNAAKSMGQLALAANPHEVWTASIEGSSPKARLNASPVIANGRLYVMDVMAVVHAFDANTGARVWEVPLKATPKAADDGKKSKHSDDSSRALFGGGVSYDDGKLYATTGVGDVVALDAAGGKQLWRVHPGGPLRGAPTIANGNIYVVTQDNQLFALKQDTGETVWTSAGTVETAGVFGAAAPAAAQGTVIAGFSSGELNAYRYENGRVVWQDALTRTTISTSVSTLSDIDADPVIDQGRVFAVGQGGRTVALELVTGQRLWELNAGGGSTPWIAGDWLFVMTDDARLLCLQASTGKLRWTAQFARWHNEAKQKRAIEWVGPVLAGGRLIVANSEGEVANVDPNTGKSIGTLDVKGPVDLQPVVANGTLYILDTKGRMHAWR
ncbi:MAG: PQQ-binding-like beta-propeller repeat protein [Sphingomonadaceae bacterium]|nr:PQQ-binding-like beta-propeller repeat protein [Sphingomonadaceae bacterium]